MPLEGDPNRFPSLAHGHSRRSLLRTDRPRLVLVLDERNTLSPRHCSDLTESLEATEHSREVLLVRRLGKLPEEQNLVRGQVLVRDYSGGRASSGLEASPLGGFRWACTFGGPGGTLEFLLGFEGLMGLFALCCGLS